MIKAIVFDLQGTLVDHHDPPCLFFHARFCLEELQGKYILALITEGRTLHDVEGLLQKLGIRHFFQIVLHLKGSPLQKSDGSAFSHTARKLGITPQEMLIVGDLPAHDILGGNRCGASTIRVRQGKHAEVKATSLMEIPMLELAEIGELLDAVGKVERNAALR